MYYRGSGPWGAGQGANLTADQFDGNNWSLVQMISAKASAGVGIANFVVVGNELWAALTDHTLLGPYTLPVASFKFRGEWAPSIQYYTNDIFTEGGSTYLVALSHVSALTFDAGANNGLGVDYYNLLLSNAPNALPTGGAVGAVLTKASTTDFAVRWNSPTLAGLTDVLQSPGPATGQLVYWNGSNFGYISQAAVNGAVQSLANLSDVLASPAPSAGEFVYWNGAHFAYASPGAFTHLATLADVLASPAPTDGQVVTWSASAGKFVYETPALSTLTDVSVSSLESRDVLVYDTATSKWINQHPFVYTAFGSTTKTLDLTDDGSLIDMSGGSGATVSIPTNATVAMPINAYLTVRQNQSQSVAISAAGGVTLSVPAGRTASTRGFGSEITLQQIGVDSWIASGDLAFDGTISLPTTGTWSLDSRLDDTPVFKFAPSGSNTINLASGGAPFGKEMTFIVTTSGTSSFTITFGANFKSQGTLATGTVSGKVFVIKFVGDGTNFNEVSRTTAM